MERQRSEAVVIFFQRDMSMEFLHIKNNNK